MDILLLCLIYKLHFTTGMYVQKKIQYTQGPVHPLGVLEHMPVDKGDWSIAVVHVGGKPE